MSDSLYITTESGRVMAFDTGTSQLRVLYDDPSHEVLFGIACHGDRMFLSGATGLTAGRITPHGFEPVTTHVPFPPPMRGEGRRLMRWLWSQVGAHSRAIPYDKPGLHQMNLYQDRLYIAATVWNEIWVVDFGLHMLERIALQPHRRDFYHLNNVFCDGAAFYVCLNRYDGRHGIGGYAKFDLAWNEIERRAIGWQSHAFSVIDGRTVQLCCLDPATDTQGRYPRRAGLLVNHDLVFEYDARQYFLKDFSMNNDRIYIVGGSTTERTNRASSTGVLFVLTRDYELIEECIFPGTGGFNGCRLTGIDYSKGVEPNLQEAAASVVATTLSDDMMGDFALEGTRLPSTESEPI
ncbi:MAG: hypothetical protein E8D47_04670 [Nitrospira sp.]|nr:MAG: hypothetical protein E8D47_04670 [Nitrospira sp.]